MIPTLLLAGFLVALVVPQRPAWLLGLIAFLGVAWALVIVTFVESSVGTFFEALGLGVINAAVGVAIGAGIRRLFRRRPAAAVPSTSSA